MKFDKNNHIIGKVYDLTQENMCAMLDYIDELEKYVDSAIMYTEEEWECMKRDMCPDYCEHCGGHQK